MHQLEHLTHAGIDLGIEQIDLLTVERDLIAQLLLIGSFFVHLALDVFQLCIDRVQLFLDLFLTVLDIAETGSRNGIGHPLNGHKNGCGKKNNCCGKNSEKFSRI